MYYTSFWEKNFDKYQSSNWIDKPSIFAKEVVKYFKKNKSILELGAGLGQDSRYFSEKGFQVTSTDASEYALNISKEKSKNHKISFLQIDLSIDLPFEDNSFDMIYAHLSLHYFDNKETIKIFSEIHRVLKDDGIFASLFNTVDDPEIHSSEFIKIDDNYYQQKNAIRKRYFSLEYLESLTKNKFDPIILDNNGKTYKDEIETLIRFVGKKHA